MAYRGEAFLAGYAESPGVPVHEAGHRFEGLEQFLFVCAAAPGTHTPSGVVAPAWRSFLLAAREYRQFCHGYLGRFVDHRTLEALAREGYLATRRAAPRNACSGRSTRRSGRRAPTAPAATRAATMASRTVTARGIHEAVPGAANAGRVGPPGPASPVAPETGRDAGDPRAAGEAEDILRMRRMQRRQVSRAEGGAPDVRGA
jgi:hypothetical protein